MEFPFVLPLNLLACGDSKAFISGKRKEKAWIWKIRKLCHQYRTHGQFLNLRRTPTNDSLVLRKSSRVRPFFCLPFLLHPFFCFSMIHSWECKDRGEGNKGESRKGGEKEEWEEKKESNLYLCWTFTVKPSFMDHLELFCVYLWSGGVSRMDFCKVWTKDPLWYLFQVQSSGRLSQPTRQNPCGTQDCTF